jgi:hypothetical protein
MFAGRYLGREIVGDLRRSVSCGDFKGGVLKGEKRPRIKLTLPLRVVAAKSFTSGSASDFNIVMVVVHALAYRETKDHISILSPSGGRASNRAYRFLETLQILMRLLLPVVVAAAHSQHGLQHLARRECRICSHAVRSHDGGKLSGWSGLIAVSWGGHMHPGQRQLQ